MMNTYIFTSIIIGAIFIGVGLVIAIWIRDPSKLVAWILRVVVSLGAGLVAVGIAGSIEVGIPWVDMTIDAGGPLAVFVLVYLKTPDYVASLRSKFSAYRVKTPHEGRHSAGT